MVRLLVLLVLTTVLGCVSENRVELRSDNGNVSLFYACTEAGPQLLSQGVATVVRQLISRETAERILAPTNPFFEGPDAAQVRLANEINDIDALEMAVASYLCERGHPPTRPPRFPEPGSQPPDFTTSSMTLDGRESQQVRLSNLRERTVVLVFWSTWCPACREEYLELQALSSRGVTEAISTYAILHADRESNLHRWRQEYGGEVEFLQDDDEAIARLYRVYGIPHTVVVRPDGRLHMSGHVHPRDLQLVVDSAAKFIDRPAAEQ